MILLETKIKFLKLTKRPWVRNDYIPNKQRFILLLETKQRFPMLKGTKNAFRIFIVLSETKSALVIKISQLYCLFAVWNSDVFSICFFGRRRRRRGASDQTRKGGTASLGNRSKAPLVAAENHSPESCGESRRPLHEEAQRLVWRERCRNPKASPGQTLLSYKVPL